MMADDDYGSAPLTPAEILELASLVDSERERIKGMINNYPSATVDNQRREEYIVTLNSLTKRLMAQIGSLGQT
jgi:hypothetical protein